MTATISQLRRRAKRLGYRFAKSNCGYQVVDISGNFVVDGSRFDLSLDDVGSFLDREEAAA